ncbi:MAG: carbohydrate ABC transporter permease [Chloroflexi bacterium]|nr:carbohydrate ABC transporter permease [Chloroflexota bacterium]
MQGSVSATPRIGAAQATHRRATLAVFTYVVLLGLGIAFAYPFLWTVGTSLKTQQETYAFPPSLLPAVPQWGNYAEAWAAHPVGRWILNSVIVVLGALPGGIITATLVAYSFARFDYPGRDVFFMVVLGTMMLPFEVTLIPQYLLFHRLGWVDTYLPLVVPSWAGGGAFAIFLLRQFFMTIPREFDDAALLDGANSLQVLWWIIVPLSRPALVALFILGFLGHWNDFLGPLVYLNKMGMFTIAVGLRFFQHFPEVIAKMEHLLMAVTVMMSLPSIVLFFVGQRFFVKGIVLSGLKL